jgi:hypothetical protein
VRDLRRHFTDVIAMLFDPKHGSERTNFEDLFDRLPKK